MLVWFIVRVEVIPQPGCRGCGSPFSLGHANTALLNMSSQFFISVPESSSSCHPEVGLRLRRTSQASILTFCSDVRSCYVGTIGEFDSIADVASSQQGARCVMSSGRTAWPNTSVEPTATSRGVVPTRSLDSTTPSRRLLSHPARRRSISEVADTFSQVAVAHLFR